ncbi:MAG: hypothetical protein QW660_06895 [Candidatus Bathyarchaeia archaeon]
MDVNIIYGWLITQVVSGGPVTNFGLRAGTKITGIDTLSAYLEKYPSWKNSDRDDGEDHIINVTVTLGARP